MNRYGIKPGFWDKLIPKKSYPGYLDVNKVVVDELANNAYPVWDDCCITPPATGDIGKVLTIGANGIVLATVSGVGAQAINTTMSISGTGVVGNPVLLVNDSASPGNLKVYGTSASGVKGYQSLKYTQTFTIGSFSSQAITINASTHLRGTEPLIQVYELVSGNYEIVMPDKISVDPSGNITISVTTGSEFNGKIIVM